MSTSRNAFSVFPAPQDQGGAIHRFDHFAMACVWQLFLVEEDETYARQAAEAAFDAVDRLERELSRFIASSDVSRINRLAPGEAVPAGLAVLDCLGLAQAVHYATGGAFDVTLGALLDSRRGENGLVQAPDEDSPGTKKLSGMDWLEINEAEHTVGVLGEGVTIDLGGIGKGYALDQMVAVLRDWSIEVALLHSGQSTVLARGAPPGQEAWEVALRDPHHPEKPLGVLHLRDRALSGSGMLLHGQHIVDPRTGDAARGKLATWAAAPSAALSDALSTAFMVMSPEEVAVFCHEQNEISAMLLLGDPDHPTPWGCGEFAGIVAR